MIGFIQRDAIFAAAAVAGAGLLATRGQGGAALTPLYKAGAFRVTVSLAAASTLSMRVTDGTTTKDTLLNAGTQLATGTCYTFTIGYSKKNTNGSQANLTYDFVLGTNVAIDLFIIDEVEAGVI